MVEKYWAAYWHVIFQGAPLPSILATIWVTMLALSVIFSVTLAIYTTVKEIKEYEREHGQNN